jgi:hypothetical protein
MSEKINVLIGANIEGLKKALAESGKSLSDFGTLAEQAPKKAKTAVDELNKSYRDAVRDAKNLALMQGQTSEAFYEAQLKAKNLKTQIEQLNQVVSQSGEAAGSSGGIQQATRGFDMLGNSVNQLTRELPAFTYSMQTGFMAISNNIPMFVDQISSIRKANAGLIADGKPVQSVFSQLATALFSWQTGLSIGVTLLTMFGAKLFSSSQDADKLAKATDDAAEAQKKLNDLRDKYLLTDLQIELKAEQKDFEELKTLLTDKLKAYEVYAHQLKLQGKQLSSEEFFDRILIQEQLKSAEIGYQKNILEIKQQAAEAQLRIQEKLERERIKKINDEYEYAKSGLEAVNEYAKKFEVAPIQFKFKLPKLKADFKPIKLENFIDTTNAMTRFDIFKMDFLSTLDDIEKRIGKWSEVIAGSLSNALTGLGSTLMSKEEDKWKDYSKMLLGLLGDLAIQIGGALIALGIPMAMAGLPTGFVYLAAGSALLIAGGALKAGSVPGQDSGNSSSQNPQSTSSQSNIPSFNPTGMMISIDGMVRGNNIVVALDNQTRMNRRVR